MVRPSTEPIPTRDWLNSKSFLRYRDCSSSKRFDQNSGLFHLLDLENHGAFVSEWIDDFFWGSSQLMTLDEFLIRLAIG
jgi:hypothetical protein